jgi:hypothetical protein
MIQNGGGNTHNKYECFNLNKKFMRSEEVEIDKNEIGK